MIDSVANQQRLRVTSIVSSILSKRSLQSIKKHTLD